MRLPSPVFALATLLLAAPCLAQAPAATPVPKAGNLPSIQKVVDPNAVAYPASARPTRIQVPGNLRLASLQALPAQQEKARKLRNIAAWGLDVPESALQPSYWLAPQVPYNTGNGASFQIVTRQRYIVSYTGSTRFPRGDVQAYGRNESDLRFLLADVPASPHRWLLLECPVEGSRTYTVTHWVRNAPRAQPARVAVARPGITIASADGRITALIEPSASPTIEIQVHGMDSPEGEWRFGGCEITPFEA